MKDHATVLVHCSDGWDRTSQLVSIAQIIIDPFYRTLKVIFYYFQGFPILIEKDWVKFGHQFAIRNGHDIKCKKDESPIFLQFLDCGHQLLFQFPDLFEFNNNLLLFLSFHVYSCIYGTFLLNSEKVIKFKPRKLRI